MPYFHISAIPHYHVPVADEVDPYAKTIQTSHKNTINANIDATHGFVSGNTDIVQTTSLGVSS